MATSPRSGSDGRPATTKRLAASNLQDSWANSPQSRSRMQAQRSRDTAAELAIRRILHKAGMRYRVDRSPILGLRRRADMVFSAVRVAVFIDGCFWHGCPEHGSKPKSNADRWEAKLARNRTRDKDTNQLLLDAGWLPIRVWEHEDPAAAAIRIAETVRNRRTSLQDQSPRQELSQHLDSISRSISPISPRSPSSSLALSDASRYSLYCS